MSVNVAEIKLFFDFDKVKLFFTNLLKIPVKMVAKHFELYRMLKQAPTLSFPRLQLFSSKTPRKSSQKN